MDKRMRQAFKPYSFRGRMLLILTISAVTASLISLGFSYAYSTSRVRTELTDEQIELATSLLELHKTTSLQPQIIADMAHRSDLNVSVAASSVLDDFSPDALEQLARLSYCTQPGKSGMPYTYVALSDTTLLVIAPAKHFNVFLIAFLRISFAGISFFSVFMLMSMLATWRIARPVSELTRATKAVAGGDFTYQLPEERTDEIGQLMRDFNRMTLSLGRTSYLQKDFISSISHEFRTPIASIKGFARLLQMPGLSREQEQEYVAMIAQESDRLSRLSTTLLRLSALEQQAAPASLSTFRLDEQVRQAILGMEPTWSAREIEWQLDLNEVTVESDSELIDQVWVNLLQNALKFSPDGATIAVSVTEKGDCAQFVVTDHGIGMDEEVLSRIFDRFYQGDKSRSREGVGLGLTLARRILDILGGSIHVASAPGEGSTFTVLLPLRIAHAKEEHHG